METITHDGPAESEATSNTASDSLTDLENARRFASTHGKYLRYVARSRHWLVWDGKRWRPDDTGEVQRRAKDTVRQLYAAASKVQDEDRRTKFQRLALAAQRAGRITGLIDLAKSEPGIAIAPDALDSNSWLLNVENGTIDLRTGELREHRPENLITKIASVCYDANATCPKWEAFLRRVMADDDELIRYVQKAIGYALTGDIREQCLFIVHGSGANGKSTTFTTVAAVIGGYAAHTPTETLLVKRSDTIPNDVARLHGARFVTAAESEANRNLAEALVKQMTGGDKMSARFLHGEFFEFTPAFKLFLAVNHKPIIRGTDHAIWRRVRLIPFTVTIPEPEQDKTLGEKLRAEGSGILRWAVEGCLLWQREGLRPPKAVSDATADYQEEMDTIQPFLDDCCRLEPNAQTSTVELYDRYREWCALNPDTEPLAKAEFGARLGEKGLVSGRSAKQRYWRGVRLTK